MARLPWHGPLFAVKGHLAERYAEALKQVRGLDCALPTFSVDRLGWSPQLAAQYGDDYLGSEALRYAIILSPDQAEAPPLRRRFSYEAPLIEQVYLDARATVLSLVGSDAIVATIDNGMTFCRNASDVLDMRTAQVELDTPHCTLQKSRELLALADGLREQSRLLDDTYIEQMIALAKQTGDPRKRAQPPELRLPIGSVWAELNGPIYVLRAPNGTVLVITMRVNNQLRATTVYPLEISDPTLVNWLHREGFLSYANAAMLLPKRIGELELDALLTADLTPAEEGTARRRQLGQSQVAQKALPKMYWELDGLQKRAPINGQLDPTKLSSEARWALSTPAHDAEVVSHLLARFVRYDYRLLVLHHRWSVQREWEDYSPAKRRYLEHLFPYMVQGFSNMVGSIPAVGGSTSAT